MTECFIFFLKVPTLSSTGKLYIQKFKKEWQKEQRECKKREKTDAEKVSYEEQNPILFCMSTLSQRPDRWLILVVWVTATVDL